MSDCEQVLQERWIVLHGRSSLGADGARLRCRPSLRYHPPSIACTAAARCRCAFRTAAPLAPPPSHPHDPRMEGLTFRPARAAELDRIADIINDPPAHGSVVIAGSVEKAMRAGRTLVRRGISLQLDHTTIAELDGEAVGVLDASANRDATNIGPALILRMLLPVIRTVGLGGLVRLVRSRPAYARVEFPQVPGSYYIAELDVDARFRNRGIGAALLRLAEEQACAEGSATLSLTTNINNPAQHLYQRAGFRIVGTKTDSEYERWSASPGRVLMVKEL